MIGKDGNGKTWFCEYYYLDPVSGKRRRHKKRGFLTRKEAKKYEAENKVLGRSEKTPTVKTFSEIADLQSASLQHSETLKRRRKADFDLRFSQYKDLPITSITKAQLVQWRADLAEDPDYSTVTKNETIRYVKSVFAYAAEVFDLPNTGSVLKSLKKTDEEVLNSEMQIWDPQEFNTFLDAVKLPVYRLFFEFLYWSGCRRGEALGLQKADFTEDYIYIHQSIKHYKNGLKPTKTRQNRKIQNDPQLWHDMQPLLSIPGPFLFGGERSLSISEVQRQFTKAIEKSHVKKIRIHDLRHSHASILINAGVNIIAISKRLGHSSINQTLQTYVHLMESTDNEMMQKLIEIKKNNAKITPGKKKTA